MQLSSLVARRRFVRFARQRLPSPLHMSPYVRMLGTNNGAGSMIERVKRFLGQDEESKARRARETAIKEAVDKVVPSHLPGLGLMGRAWVALVKSFAARILGTFADSMADIGKIHSEASRYIISDKNVKALLGDDIECSVPYTSNASSIKMNNEVSSRISISFPVTGSAVSGDAHVSATIDADRNVNITSIVVTTRGGPSVHVHVSKKHKIIIDV